MGVEAALIGGGLAAAAGGTVGQVIAGEKQAEATTRQAEAQLAARREERDLAIAASEPTLAEIKAMERSIALNESAIARNERILDATDPALIEAGEQALELLRGQDAAILEPIREDRDRQREELRARLADQLGSGFETSTAGIKALNQFDQQTSSLIANAQLQAVSGLLGTAGQTRQIASPFQGVRSSMQLADLAAAPARRKVSAITGTPIAPFAGASEAGNIIRAQTIGGAFGTLGRLGGIGLGAGLGKLVE